jgi:hypothetical protein
VLAPLVVRREAGGVRRLGDLAFEDLLEGVGALARGRVDVAHQMHVGGLCAWVCVGGSEENLLRGWWWWWLW